MHTSSLSHFQFMERELPIEVKITRFLPAEGTITPDIYRSLPKQTSKDRRCFSQHYIIALYEDFVNWVSGRGRK